MRLLCRPPRVPDLTRRTGLGAAWGVNAALYGLRGADNGGLGNYDDLARAAQALGSKGAQFLGINPVHALGWAMTEIVIPACFIWAMRAGQPSCSSESAASANRITCRLACCASLSCSAAARRAVSVKMPPPIERMRRVLSMIDAGSLASVSSCDGRPSCSSSCRRW